MSLVVVSGFSTGHHGLLTLNNITLNTTVLPAPTFTALSAPHPHVLALGGLRAKRSVGTRFFSNENCVRRRLTGLGRFFHSCHTGGVGSVSPKLFSRLCHLRKLLNAHGPIRLVSNCHSVSAGGRLHTHDHKMTGGDCRAGNRTVSFRVRNVTLDGVHGTTLSVHTNNMKCCPHDGFIRVSAKPTQR